MGVPASTTFLVLLRPTRLDMPSNPTEEESRLAHAHFAYYEALLASGVLVHAGRTLEPPFVGIMICNAPSIEEAERVVRSDPAVAGGVFQATVQPYRVALSGS